MASTFGTQAELQAAASLFQIFIYVFHKRSEERGWEWMRYKPYTKESLSYSGVSIPDAPGCEYSIYGSDSPSVIIPSLFYLSIQTGSYGTLQLSQPSCFSVDGGTAPTGYANVPYWYDTLH